MPAGRATDALQARRRPGPTRVIHVTALRAWFCILVAAALVLSGCAGDPRLLDPISGAIASQRKAAVDDVLQGAGAVADQFDAGGALGVRTDTVCSAGTDNWKIHDPYRSECFVELTTAYAVDISPLPALSGLETPLKTEGWFPRTGGWKLTGGRGEVNDLATWNRLGYHLDDLDSIAFTGRHDGFLSIRPQSSSTPVLPPKPANVVQPGGAYFVSTEGTDWQAAWTQQQSDHPYLLLVSGIVTFARQPW